MGRLLEVASLRRRVALPAEQVRECRENAQPIVFLGQAALVEQPVTEYSLGVEERLLFVEPGSTL